ncbi:MAG: hypothetical protein IKP88_03020 [Lachnospiraceae bacterium]|nr:hypothetical protein [Lachnospiraceae bacterium]
MKKAKIVLILSLLVFITLLIVFLVSGSKNKEEEKPVSQREQYQREYEQKNEE